MMQVPQLAQTIATEFAVPPVVAIALAGSRTNEADALFADFDFYIYVSADIPMTIRADIAGNATRIKINNQVWETKDEWIDPTSGCGIDV